MQLDPPLGIQSNPIFLELVHWNGLILYTHSLKGAWEGWDDNSHVCSITDCWTCNDSLVKI